MNPMEATSLSHSLYRSNINEPLIWPFWGPLITKLTIDIYINMALLSVTLVHFGIGETAQFRLR